MKCPGGRSVWWTFPEGKNVQWTFSWWTFRQGTQSDDPPPFYLWGGGEGQDLADKNKPKITHLERQSFYIYWLGIDNFI